MNINVTVLKKVEAKKGIKALKFYKKQDMKIKAPCKKGKCGKCVIKILNGKTSEPTKNEIKALGEEKIKQGYRLACETTFLGDVTLEDLN